MKTRLFIILLGISSIGFISCTGPTGPRGADGTTIFSDVIKLRTQDFVEIDDYLSVAEFNWDLLDEATVDYGLVLGYLRFESETAWHPLPYTIPFENDLVNVRYSFDIDSFNVIIEGENPGNHNMNVDLLDRTDLRVIAIPPDKVIRAKGLDYSNYEDVIMAYGLEK